MSGPRPGNEAQPASSKAAKKAVRHGNVGMETHKGTVRLHQICHSTIHAALTEAELARDFADVEALKAHPRIARFIAWVQDRPPEFHARTAGPRRARRR